MKKLWNWLTALLVVLMLAAALSIQFSPEADLKDMLLNLSELPGNVFRFRWERPEGEAEEEIPEETEKPTEEKEETPFIPFDDMEQEPEATQTPMKLLPAEGINKLPDDNLRRSAED